MTVCPYCKARGVKLDDVVGPSYCGRCGKSWPATLSATVASDGVPPPPDGPRAKAGAQAVSTPRVQFAARVGELADRFRSGERFADQSTSDVE